MEGHASHPGEDRSRHEFSLVLDGYEGPLDLLLELARKQKVDLRCLSILALADQFLAFIGQARRLQIELAADYLLMAAWLAYLKSGLLLPEEEQERAGAEEAAARFQARLAQLEAMRKAGKRLLDRPVLGREFFPRGRPQAAVMRREPVWIVTLSDLLEAYARVQARESYAPLHLQRPPVISMDEALLQLRATLPELPEWRVLAAFLPQDWREGALVRSAMGSVFAGALELVRTGDAEIRQDRPFAPIFLRAREGPDERKGVALEEIGAGPRGN